MPKKVKATKDQSSSSDDSSDESSSSSSSSSSSEKVVKKVSKKSQANGKKSTKVGDRAKSEKSSSKKPASKKTNDKKSTKKSTKKPTSKKESSSSSESSSSDESSSSEEEVEKPEKNKKAQSKKAQDSSDESSSSDSSSADKAKASKKSDSSDSDSSSSSSSSEDDSDSSEDEKEKPSKKRKADDTPQHANKKQKINEVPAAAPGDEDITRLYLGNLPFSIDDDSIREFFKDCGTLTEISWVTDKATGKFYGTGFVELDTPENARKALALNGSDCNGRPIKIELARPRAPRQEGGGKFGGAGGRFEKGPSKKEEGCRTIFIGNLSFDINDDVVNDTFKSCGEIKAIRWVSDKATGKFKGCGFVEFEESEATDKAVALNGATILGRPMRVDFSNPKPRGGYD